jgi:ubiquinone/menaquinone biosynthesis C-methylase UbiE
MDSAQSRQAAYYARTAATYDAAHLAAGDEHFIALEYVAGLCRTVGAETLLDVGAGTGRAIQFLRQRLPTVRMTGVEPVEELRQQAITREPGVEFINGTGERLPFADGEFDVVLATAVMHHVAQPETVIAEMTRVARKAVIVSDANRFGQGSLPARLVKLALYRLGLWSAYDFVRTRGRRYMESAGDGIFYSYSVFDSLPQLNAWASRTFVIPTQLTQPPTKNHSPLLGASQALVAAVREPCTPQWASPV